jgi:hypothetical protein
VSEQIKGEERDEEEEFSFFVLSLRPSINTENNNNNKFTVMVSLAFQRRLAMSIFHCGWRKVWLDPNKKHIIVQARTRTDPFFVVFNKDQIKIMISMNFTKLRNIF